MRNIQLISGRFTPRASWARQLNLALSALAVALIPCVSPLRADDPGLVRDRAPELPSPLCDLVNVPVGHHVSSHAYALGVQIYQWNGTQWIFVAPEAVLYADPCYRGQIGIHYVGPTWEANDGSRVIGTRVAGCAPNPGAIPWLRLAGDSTPGGGRFARITFIQRVNTIGGTVPAEPGTFAGQEARVPYTAEYYFFRSNQLSPAELNLDAD